MSVTPAQAVKELRELTGLGMMECKKLLEEAGGNLDKAKVLAVARGQRQAAKLADRITSEGTVGVYVHTNKKLGAMVELNCNTDFVARGDQFQSLARDLAMHVVAMNPRVVRRDELNPAEVQAEEKLQRGALELSGNLSDEALAKAMKPFFEERVLLDQPFVKDPSKTVQDVINDNIGTIKENITVKRFSRIVVGETQ